MNATQKLVTKFVQLGGETQSSLLRDEAYLKCQTAQTEVNSIPYSEFRSSREILYQCAALRSQMDVMRAKLEDSEAQKEKFYTDLIAAEIRADRLRSETVLAMQARVAVEKQEPKTDEIEEPQRKPSSPAVSGWVNWWEFRPF
jgi:E3 ubiquitin-protein ligase BRE1